MKKYSENRPWGKFEQFCKNEKATVKIISVNPNSKLSLQYHNNRDEFWKVVSGEAKITIGEKVTDAKKGDEFFIPKLSSHRIETLDFSAEIMEVSFGDFDEDDIVRLEDSYGRI